MTRRPRKHIKAIPTSFNGVKYKSRLEARFAEWLHGKGVSFKYEQLLPGSEQQYTADFCIPESLGEPLYIEIKPQSLIHELQIFRDDIIFSEHNWICVDRADRDSWRITWSNLSFSDGARVIFPDAPRFDFVRLEELDDESFFLRVYPEHVDLNWY